MMQKAYIFSFTHKKFNPEELSALYIEPDRQKEVLHALQTKMGWKELMYIGTCNRVEIAFVCEQVVTLDVLRQALLLILKPTVIAESYIDRTGIYREFEAVRHLFRVSSSLDSMVVGEREIITQVRQSFEACDAWGLCGPVLRLMVQKTIEVGKAVYTHTDIARNPVSVVSLAYHTLAEKGLPKEAKILMVGAGQTNTAFARTLRKHGYTQLHIFNRSFAKAQKLAEEVDAKAYTLDQLDSFHDGFDVLITCTGAEQSVIPAALFENNPSKHKRWVFDLALPYDISREFASRYHLQIVGLETLKEMAEKNLQERHKEVAQCEQIIEQKMQEFKTASKQRKVELAMQEVPAQVKNIKQMAMQEVFAQDLEQLDANSKVVLDKILSYMEKKYISVPMKMAREILLETEV